MRPHIHTPLLRPLLFVVLALAKRPPLLRPLLFVALALGIFLLASTLGRGAPTLLSYNANNASIFIQISENEVSENRTGIGLLDPSRVQPCYFSSSSGLSDTCKCSVPPYRKLSDSEGNTRTRQYWREGENYTCLFPKGYYIHILGPGYAWGSMNTYGDGKALGKITSLTWMPPKPGLYQILGSTIYEGPYDTLIANIEIQGAGPTFWDFFFWFILPGGFIIAIGGVWISIISRRGPP